MPAHDSSYSAARHLVEKDWGPDSPQLSCFECICRSFPNPDYVSAGMVSALCQVPWDLANDVLAYLSGERLALFHPWFGYEDAWGDLHELPAEQVVAFLEGRGQLFDEDDGRPLTAEDVYLYYRGSEAMREVINDRTQ